MNKQPAYQPTTKADGICANCLGQLDHTGYCNGCKPRIDIFGTKSRDDRDHDISRARVELALSDQIIERFKLQYQFHEYRLGIIDSYQDLKSILRQQLNREDGKRV